MKVLIVIPARYKSSRLPGKPLKDILGKPMIIRVADICSKALSKENVWITTDDERIKNVCDTHGYNSIIINKNCKTGTDRIAYFSKKIHADIYINVQGDEPLINHKSINKIIETKKKYKNYIINGYTLLNNDNPTNRNIPKVVINKHSNLIYMSRSEIPSSKSKNNNIQFFKQVCIYAFTKLELKVFLEIGKKIPYYEKNEDIEILRFFETDRLIKMVKLNESNIAVDTPKDLKRVREFFANK